MSRRTEITLATGFVVIVLGVGLTLMLTTADGSKWSNLGIGLIAGLVPGVALLVVQQSFASVVRQQGESRAFGSSTEPTSGKQDEPPPGVAVRPEAPTPPPPPHVAPIEPTPAAATSQTRHHYTVQYIERQRDTSRIDAVQARLRVFRDDEYFQFVAAVASGIDLRLIHGVRDLPNDQLWRAICELAGDQIRDAIHNGHLPLSKPIDAYEVFPNVEKALTVARQRDPLREGDVVSEFDAG